MIKKTQQRVIGEFPITPGDTYKNQLENAYKILYSKSGEGSEMTDWLDWPSKYFASAEYKRLKETAAKIRNDSSSVVVVGIGGSYLTPQMLINSRYGEFYNEFAESGAIIETKIYYAGCDLSPDRLNDIISSIDGEEWSIIYVSKSGGTMEPALAFRVLWNELQEKYGDEANKRVYAVTDAEKGILKGMANEHGWESFVIPDGIGGRYSAFTACGLLPIAVAGIDTDALLQGAIAAAEDCKYNSDCFAMQYAMWRLYNFVGEEKADYPGHNVEFYATNTPDLSFFAEWLKQLFGESEGKEGKGLFPTSGVFPRDLHSLGQYLQEGLRDEIFETFIIRDFKTNLTIPESDLNDNLEKYQGKNFIQAANAAMDGAYKAHTEGGNPCSIIRVGPTLEDMGYLMQSMFVACAVSAYAIGVNPFDQPGVEQHKVAMKSSPEWDK